MNVDGMTFWVSSYGIAKTVERIRRAVADHGMSVLGHIDHRQAAASAGLEVPALQVLVFCDPVASAQLILTAPTIAIDLPLRVIVWVDEGGSTWLAYNDPGWIAARHGARAGNEQVLGNMRRALTAVAEYVVRGESEAVRDDK